MGINQAKHVTLALELVCLGKTNKYIVTGIGCVLPRRDDICEESGRGHRPSSRFVRSTEKKVYGKEMSNTALAYVIVCPVFVTL